MVERGRNVHCSISGLAYASTSTTFPLSKCKMLLYKVNSSVTTSQGYRIYFVSVMLGGKTNYVLLRGSSYSK